MNIDFNYKSYETHKKHYKKNFDTEKINSWKSKKTIDYWRHERMYSKLMPIIKAYPDSSWLTVGDGRFGTDANYLLTNGIKNVLASDISDTYLEIAKRENFILDYKLENAENLSFENNTFDFVLCKEAYHHFPRPIIALYEMLRVAKNAVILIEPQDGNILSLSRLSLLKGFSILKQSFKNKIKCFFNRKPYNDYGSYEPVGNYIYTISEREIEKVALGLNYEMVSFYELNDHYIEGVEYENVNENSKLFEEIRKEINNLDSKTQKGLIKAGLLISIIFKNIPSKECIIELEKIGFENKTLTRNPYSKI